MNTLETPKLKAIEAYNQAGEDGRNTLKKLFGEDLFLQKITDLVKTFEDALELASPSENLKTLLEYNGNDQIFIGAKNHAKLSIIAQALNEGWKADYSDKSQYKYYPWFEHKTGFGLSYANSHYDGSYSTVGSRLCFKTSELAEYAGKQFKELYRAYLS